MDHYVDNSLARSGDGTSWSQAWNGFAAIDWSTFRPGDTLQISGGTSGRTYQETLTVGASGSAAGAITITAGTDPGHDGGVVIDGGGVRYNGVVVYARDHVVVQDLHVQNITSAGFSVKYATAGVVLENNSVFSGDAGDSTARGYDVRGSVGDDAVLVRGNSYATPANTRSQTDGIYSMDNDGVVFENNRIVISNSNTYGHSDAFQSFQDKNIVVRNNWFEQANIAPYNNHGAWLENTQTGGTIKFHGNVVSAPNVTGDAAVAHYMRAGWAGTGSAEIWNNTIIGGARTVYLDNSPGSTVYNNIIVPSAGGHAAVVLGARPPLGNFDGNLMWSPSGTTVNMGAGNLSWAAWRALGYDAQGVNADPLFADAAAKDFSLAPGSPAIDHGVALSELATDFRGAPRVGNHDIGAYEANAVPPQEPAVPPPVLFGSPGIWGQDAMVASGDQQYGATEYLAFRATTAWGGVQAVQMAPTGWSDDDPTALAFDNFVETTLDLRAAGNTSLDVMVVAARAGEILTGGADDIITWVAASDATNANNIMVIRTGGGNDTVRITAIGLSPLDSGDRGPVDAAYTGRFSTANVSLGRGNDDVSVEGDVRLLLRAVGHVTATGGGANDRLCVGLGGGDLIGGAGRDTFVFNARSGDTTILDFTSGVDRIRFLKMTADDIDTAMATRHGVDGMLLTNADTDTTIFLAHVSQLAAADMVFG